MLIIILHLAVLQYMQWTCPDIPALGQHTSLFTVVSGKIFLSLFIEHAPLSNFGGNNIGPRLSRLLGDSLRSLYTLPTRV